MCMQFMEVEVSSTDRITGASTNIALAGFSMDSTSESLVDSDCTSCGVTQDKSAYWTPALYFMHTNGSAELVEEVGGMLA